MWQEVPYKKITETTPGAVRGASRTVSVPEAKAIFVGFERAAADRRDKKCELAL